MKLEVTPNHIDRSLQRFATNPSFSSSRDCPIGIAALEAFNLNGGVEFATCDGWYVSVYNTAQGTRQRYRLDEVGKEFTLKFDNYRHRNEGAVVPNPVVIELTEVS